MERPLNHLLQRTRDRWLIGYDTRLVADIAQQLFEELTQHATPPKILLAERKIERFFGSFIAAVTAGCPLFLANPNWSEQEWQQVFDRVQPNLIWGEQAQDRGQKADVSINYQPSSLIMIPTGGSTGQIRFAIHSWETLTASVRGFSKYFQVSSVNSFCVLPLYHVSGLMQFMRSFTTGGKLVILPSYKDILARFGKGIENDNYTEVDPAEFFISFVPTQLNRLLQNSEATGYLSHFKAVLLGGAPAWPELLESSRRQGIPLALTYGMTETASQIVTLKPADFLDGNNSCGRVLPHGNVTICSADGEILSGDRMGIVTVEAESLALGYYGDRSWGFSRPSPSKEGNSQKQGRIFQTDDVGFFDDRGYLNIVGRSSDKIITGGENVFPAEVEAAIRATGLVEDVCAIALPDRDWGQAIGAVYVPNNPVHPQLIADALENKLAKFKRPKYWLAVDSLPRNAQGKVNREQLYKSIALDNFKHN